jgi:glyoxylase-like metal-dependent hydrolase (beta-lactamase superfamily II)
MNRSKQTLAKTTAAAVMLAFIGNASAQFSPQTELHLDAATRNTLGDADLMNNIRYYFCGYTDNPGFVNIVRSWNTIKIPLTQIAGDTWYLGSKYVGQYILRSPTGFVLVDSLNNTAEARDLTIPALQSLGLSASLPLQGVYLTHGHGDHDGGANYLRQTLNPPIYLGSGDANNKAYNPIRIDSTNLAPQPITIGGRTLTLIPTPGHTPGTMAAVIPVQDNGREVNLLVTGGSNMGGLSTVYPYLDSLERTYALAKAMNVEGGMHPHQFFEGTLQKILDSGLSTPSQYVVGNDKYMRGLAVWRECTAAFASNLDATAALPVWRASKTEFIAASPAPNRLAARVFNGWGPVAGQQVSFTLEGRGTACTATTDENGVATCKSSLGPLKGKDDLVTATFAGAEGSGYVDLGSKVTALANNGCADLAAIRAAMGARAGDANYASRLDVDQNGVIDGRDLSSVTRDIQPGFCK